MEVQLLQQCQPPSMEDQRQQLSMEVQRQHREHGGAAKID